MTRKLIVIILFTLQGTVALGACKPSAPVVPTGSPTDASVVPGAGIANPASENCIAKGGTLEIKSRGDGGQYGVCFFEDNLQCEEWALMNGECRVGGMKLTGYQTDAAKYCVITGGEYAITAEESGPTPEQGTCTYAAASKTCDVWALWNGTCSKGASASKNGSSDRTAP